jgi:formylglycine-generating enzyme required for sulfatase activity
MNEKCARPLFLLLGAAAGLAFCVAGCGQKTAPAPVAPASAASARTIDLGRGQTIGLARVPAGVAMLGSPPSEEAFPENQPPHAANFETGFFMSQFEITQMQYSLVMDANPSIFMDKSYPVESITVAEARAFCRALGKKTGETVRLPTEQEWEYACRAGSTSRFALGDDVASLERSGWFAKNSEAHPHRAGTLAPNKFGIYDMHGNVWEFCEPDVPVKEAMQQAVRGGSWMDDALHCRSASRAIATPEFKNSNIGFRILVEVRR